MIKLIITDNLPVVRQGLKLILENCIEISSIEEAENGSQLLEKIIENDYDVVLFDISMPWRNGLDILNDIKSIKPKVAVIMLSIYPEEQYAVKAMRLGASGYLWKSSSAEELITALLYAARGRKYITQTLADIIAQNIDKNTESPLHDSLSDRRLEVMYLLAKGLSIKEIAGKILVSPKSVSTYKERILSKMLMNSTAEIISYAIQKALVD